MKQKRHPVHITILSLILLSFVFTILYLFYKPETVKTVEFNHYNKLHVDYLNIKEHIAYDTKAYFFCSPNNDDCIYTDTEIIPALLDIANTEIFDQIYYVDITDINENILPSALKNHLGFSNYPAFAVLSYENNKIVVHSVYEWRDDSVFTVQNLKQWMVENQLWKTEYTN